MKKEEVVKISGGKDESKKTNFKNKRAILLVAVLLVIIGAAIIFLIYPYIAGFAVGPKNETTQSNMSQNNKTNVTTINQTSNTTLIRVPVNYTLNEDTNSDEEGEENGEDSAAECGNDILESGEDCDEGSSNANSSDTDCYGEVTYCDESCNEVTVDCDTYCGDSLVDSGEGEQCDESNLSGQMCESIGYVSGTLSCASDCDFDLNNCTQNFIISSCQIINQTNKGYILNANIANDSLAEACIKILAENITLDCQGYSIVSSNDVAGVYSNSSSTTIKNCNINVGENSGGYGIYLERANNSYIFNNTLNSQYTGLFLEETSDSLIESNYINENLNKGIHLLISYNNQIKNNEINNGSFYGIVSAKSANNIIQNNNLIGNVWYGIIIEASLSGEPDGNNQILNNAVSLSRENIYVKTSNNVIKGNTLRYSQLYNGLYIYNTSGNLIKDNVIESNKVSGIGLNEASNNDIVNNILNSNEEYGIEVYLSNSNTIENNTASSNSINGLYLEASSGNSIKDNVFCNNTEDVYCDSSQIFESNNCNSGSVCGGSCEVCGLGELGEAGITGGVINVKKGAVDYSFIIIFIAAIIALAILVNLKKYKKK